MKVLAGKRPPVPTAMPGPCSRMVEKAWHADASRRPTCASVVATLEATLDSLPLGASQLPALPQGGADALDNLLFKR